MRSLKNQTIKRKNKKKVVRSTRKRNSKGTGKITKVFFVALLIVFCVSIAAFFSSQIFSGSLFAIKKIDFIVSNGAEDQNLNRNDVVSLAGINMGTNLFKLDMREVSKRILNNAWVEAIKLDRIWPNKVVINVKRRHAKALIKCDKFKYIDDLGKLVGDADDDAGHDYPILTDFSCDGSDEEKVKKALGLISKFEKNGFEISELNYDEKYGMTLYLSKDTFPIIFGSEDYDVKFKRFAEIYNDLKKNKLKCASLDLNYSTKGIVRLKNI
ncbi:MAG: FtsQ-type POTRA domain-containing protein [Pseudomonadota bacterium]